MVRTTPFVPRHHLGYDEITISAFPGHYKTKRVQLTAAIAGVEVCFVDASEIHFNGCAVQKYPMARVIEHKNRAGTEWFIFSTSAICRYIARLRRDCALLGDGFELESLASANSSTRISSPSIGPPQAAVDSAVDFVTHELEVPLALLMYQSLGAVSRDSKVTSRALREVSAALRKMEAMLNEGGRGFLVPGTRSISLADIFAITVLLEGLTHGLFTLDTVEFRSVDIWRMRMIELPMIRKWVGENTDVIPLMPGPPCTEKVPSPSGEGMKRAGADGDQDTQGNGKGSGRKIWSAKAAPRIGASRETPPRGDHSGHASGSAGGVVASKIRSWERKVSEARLKPPSSTSTSPVKATHSHGEDVTPKPAGRFESSTPSSGHSAPLARSAGTARVSPRPLTVSDTSPRSTASSKKLMTNPSGRLLLSPRATKASQLREARAAAIRKGNAGTESSSGPKAASKLRTAIPEPKFSPDANSKVSAARLQRQPFYPGPRGVKNVDATKTGAASARGRLEGGEARSGKFASNAAFLSLPIKRRSVEDSIAVTPVDELRPMPARDHLASGLWPAPGPLGEAVQDLKAEACFEGFQMSTDNQPADNDNIGASVSASATRGLHSARGNIAEPLSANSEFQTGKGSSANSTIMNASQEESFNGVRQLIDRIHDARLSEYEDDKSGGQRTAAAAAGGSMDRGAISSHTDEPSAESHSFEMISEGQHFGRNSDRRRLHTAGRFGTLSLKMETEGSFIADQATKSAPSALVGNTIDSDQNGTESQFVNDSGRFGAPASQTHRGLASDATLKDILQLNASEARGGRPPTAGQTPQQSSTGRIPPPPLSMGRATPTTLSQPILWGAQRTAGSLNEIRLANGFISGTIGQSGDPVEAGSSLDSVLNIPLPDHPSSLNANGQVITTGLGTAWASQGMFSAFAQKRPSIPSSGSYKQKLNPSMPTLPPPTELITDVTQGKGGAHHHYYTHHQKHAHHKRPAGHVEHHAAHHGGGHNYAGHPKEHPRHHHGHR